MLTLNALDRVITAARASILTSIFHSHVLCFITRQQCVMCCHWTATLRPFILSCTHFPSLTPTVLRVHSESQQHTFKPTLCAVNPPLVGPVMSILCLSYCVKFLRWEWAFQRQLWGLYINAHTGLEGYIYRLHTLSVCTCVCVCVCVRKWTVRILRGGEVRGDRAQHAGSAILPSFKYFSCSPSCQQEGHK